MMRYGVRRCDACSSEMLGRGGQDLCYLCRLLLGNDPDIALDEIEDAAHVLVFPARRSTGGTTVHSD